MTQADKMYLLGLLKQYRFDGITYELLFEEGEIYKYDRADLLRFFLSRAFVSLQSLNQFSKPVFLKYLRSIYVLLKRSFDFETTVDSSFLSDLAILSSKYQEFVLQNRMKEDSTILQELEQIESLRASFAVSSDDLESILLLKTQITNLEKEIRNLEREKEQFVSQVTQQQNFIKKKEQREQQLKKERERFHQRINELERQILHDQETLNQQQVSLQAKDDMLKKWRSDWEYLSLCKNDLEKQLALLEARNNDLNDVIHEKDQFQQDVSSMQEEIQLLSLQKARLEEMNHSFLNEQNAREQKYFIQEMIWTLMCESPVSISDILKCLKERQICITEQEAYQYLNSLKDRFSISGPHFEQMPPVYKLDQQVLQNQTMFLTLPKKHSFEFLFTSDFHFSDPLIYKAEIHHLYDYASKNGIFHIFNLGDLYDLDFRFSKKTPLEQLSMMEDVVFKTNQVIPENTNIYHFFLGGNHDAAFLNLGYDGIQKLSMMRPEFVPMGYYLANIELGKKENLLRLHHPYRRITALTGEDAVRKTSVTYLSDYYQKRQLSREDVFCDFFGHIHQSYLDSVNGYCLVPSLFRDRVMNGAWHVKVYFDYQKNIDYMVFLPLVFQNILQPVSEYVYQRKKEK